MMKAVRFINPEGETVEVPEHEAGQFDAFGWERADGSKPSAKEKTKQPDNKQ